jgi:hypothetical protein
MSLEYISGINYGQPLVITFTDKDTNAAANISSYTTAQQMHFKQSKGVVSIKTAAFVTDGSDGEITYTLTEGDFDPPSGKFWVRGVVYAGSARLATEWVEETLV